MPYEKRELLDALRAELRFLESGGYDPSVRNPREELRVFRDSPSCLNYGYTEKTYPCSQCWLIGFVPEDRRGEALPCHHIPLNERGDTLAGFAEEAEDPRVAEMLAAWLRRSIGNLEREAAHDEELAAAK